MNHTKTLFFIDDKKSQIFIFHILRKYSVCTDYDIHLTFFQICDRLFLLRSRTEPAKKIYSHRKLFHSLNKGVINLLCKNRGRYKINNLAAFLNCFKRSSQRNLCLAISDIPTHKTVHNLGALHIFLSIFDRSQLIFCFLIRKHLFKLSLPDGIWSTDITFFFLADCIKLHKFPCNILHGTADSGFRLFPFLPTKPIQFRRFCCFCPGIFLQCIQLCCKNIQITSITIFDFDIILCNFIYCNFLNTFVNAESMLFMHYIVSNGKFRKVLDSLSIVFFFLFTLFLLFSKDICLCDDCKFNQRIFKSPPRMAIDHHDLSRLQNTIRILSVECVQTFFLKIFCQTFCTGSGTGQQNDLISFFFVLFQILYQQFKTTLIRAHRFYCDIKLT